MPTAVNTFTVEDAQLIFRNFEGKEGPYNIKGNRGFSVILPPEAAEQLLADGWNVKWLKPREEGDIPSAYIEVAVSYKNRPPRIALITSAGKTHLDEDTVDVLDWASIEKADLICRAYHWELGEKSGIKAYLQTLVVTIEEDALERKYGLNEVAAPASE